jgi:hypothetical protein
MIPMRISAILRIAAALVMGAPLVCHAALGDTGNSISTDQKRMRAATRNATEHAHYTVHEMQSEAGVTVREYVSSDGFVFAVTWSGPTKPNLGQLLGKYFARYQAAGRTAHGGHRHATLRNDDLVVQSSGHLRAFSGLAYLPQRIPQGVTIDEIQ